MNVVARGAGPSGIAARPDGPLLAIAQQPTHRASPMSTSSVDAEGFRTSPFGRNKWTDRLALPRSAQTIEVAALLLGVVLRVVTTIGYDPTIGYDFGDHWKHINWFRDHLSIPAANYTRTTYHAPLYHFLFGLLARTGLAEKGLQFGSLVVSCTRLALLALGLRLALPSSPRARAVALMLAAVMPCSVHLDAMETQEPLSNLLTTLALVLALFTFRAEPRRRWGWALALGAVAGLELLTKISGLALAGVIAMAGPIEAVLAPSSTARERLRRLAPWLAATLVMVAVGGWWYVRCHMLYQHAFLSSWDVYPSNEILAVNATALPEVDRRSLGYLVGWSTDIYRDPYYPSGISPHSRFWPVLVASTFVDYYRFGLAAGGLDRVQTAARLSVIAGTFIAAITVVAWLFLAVRLARRRDAAHLAMLALPLLGLLGALSFAIQFPYDFEGVVKGVYLHFAAAPLYAVFGLGVVWLGRRPLGKPLAWAATSSVAAVAAYTIACRLH
jgi:hypothetical protein